MRRHRTLDRQQRRQLVVLQNDVAVRIDNEPDVEEAILPVFVTRLGLRHDVDVPLPRELADLVGLGARNIDATRASVVGVVHVEYFIIESHQRAFRNGEQTDRNIKIGKPECRLGEALEVLDVVFDFLAPANAPETGNEADGVIGLDHGLPLRIKFPC